MNAPLRLSESGHWVAAESSDADVLPIMDAREYISRLSPVRWDTDAQGHITALYYSSTPETRDMLLRADLLWVQPLQLLLMAGPGAQSGVWALHNHVQELEDMVSDYALEDFSGSLGGTSICWEVSVTDFFPSTGSWYLMPGGPSPAFSASLSIRWK